MPQFMKIQAVENKHRNTVTAYGDDYVCINAVSYANNLIVMPERLVEGWTANVFDTLAAEDMRRLAELDVEVVLLGAGKQLRFPRPQLMRIMAEAGRGLEVMDFAAACRTFNLLANEGRNVAAALLFA